MYKLDASAFQAAIVILHQTIGMVEANSQIRDKKMSGSNAKTSADQLERLKLHVQTLQCPITEQAIDDLIGSLKLNELIDDMPSIPGTTYDQYGQMAVNISKTLERELRLKFVYVLDSLKAKYYEPNEPLWGAEVQNKFPSIIPEIDQAGKCYACDLTTASAFHSIRCLEAGIRAIARCLGIPDPTKGKDRNWSNVSASIKTEIDRRWPHATGRMSGDAQLFDEIYGSLVGMQNPYRNATMHLDATYTAPDAIYIFEIAKGLMRRVASRMDENGQPLA